MATGGAGNTVRVAWHDSRLVEVEVDKFGGIKKINY